MTNSNPHPSRLSTAEIEALLASADLPETQRSVLVEELTTRLEQELLTGLGSPATGPSRSDPKRASGSRRQMPPPQHPQGRPPTPSPDPSASVTGPPPPPAVHVPQPPPSEHSRSPEAAIGHRTGFRRFLVSLVALGVVAIGAWSVLTMLEGLSGEVGPVLPDLESNDDGNAGSETVGPAGTARVEWVFLGVTHTADLKTDGTLGVAEVSYVDDETGELRAVRQDLRFAETSDGYNYTGRDPRDALTGSPAADYSADVFWMELGSDGWYFTEVCDTTGNLCEPVTAQE